MKYCTDFECYGVCLWEVWPIEVSLTEWFRFIPLLRAEPGSSQFIIYIFVDSASPTPCLHHSQPINSYQKPTILFSIVLFIVFFSIITISNTTTTWPNPLSLNPLSSLHLNFKSPTRILGRNSNTPNHNTQAPSPSQTTLNQAPIPCLHHNKTTNRAQSII